MYIFIGDVQKTSSVLTSKMTMMQPSFVGNPVSSPLKNSFLSFPSFIVPSSTKPTTALISSSQIYYSAIKTAFSDNPGI